MKTISKETLLHQEIVNSISHGAGLLFGIISIPYLIAIATKNVSTAGVIAACMYGFGFLMVFTFSTLYHSFKQPRKKYIFIIFGHISIYFLIAGTYTPFIIIYVNTIFGMSLLVALWTLTLMGIFFKVFYTGCFENLSTAIYLLMGMLLLAGGKTFFAAMPVNIVELIIAGGVLYATGVLFYVWKKYTYHHGVWHLFVLAAAICHYVAVLKTIGYQ
ncbi:MAG: hemolysin III family protein [Ferruginibacter sp.]|nr:hemolysin III family protein [Ferruginibacter sp.]